MIVDDVVVVEGKATFDLHPAFTRKVYNYLRATSLQVGLLLHFGPEPQFFRLDAPAKPIQAITTKGEHDALMNSITADNNNETDPS
jgi:hypothetical protein